MGCPPDPVEVGISRDNTAARDAETKFRDLGDEKQAALKLFEQLKELAGKSKEVHVLINSIQQGINEQKVAEPGPPGYGDYADAQEASLKRSYAEQVAKERENSLCIIRDGLLKLVRYIPEEKLASLRERVNVERERHRVHRADDRKTWLDWLQDRIRLLTFYEEKAKAKNADLSYFTKHLAKLEQEVNRVTALSSDAMIEDRALFGRNPGEFEADYDQFRHLCD